MSYVEGWLHVSADSWVGLQNLLREEQMTLPDPRLVTYKRI
jgi:hypothetical protein